MRTRHLAAALTAAAITAAVAFAGPAAAAGRAGSAPTSAPATTTTPIQHFLFLMQGSASFDHYFGTYPSADGIPAKTCQPLVAARPSSGCVSAFALHGRPAPVLGGSNGLEARQIDGGKMDGFVSSLQRQGRDGTVAMGYFDRRDLPVSWQLADRYVLFDRFFSSSSSGTRANRGYWVAAAAPPSGSPSGGYGNQPTIFDRLEAKGISWKFYVQDYDPRQTFRSASPANPVTQTQRVPLLNYPRFVDNKALNAHIADLREYDSDLAHGTLPAVAFVASSHSSERSARSLASGQNLVRHLVTQLSASPFWSSSALLVSYDSAGGWYDHVAPPVAGDGGRLGIRVPALLVSPFARAGAVVHTPVDAESALAFIERNWRLLPLTNRDAKAHSISEAFAFGAAPRAPEAVSAPRIVRPHNPVTPVYWAYGTVIVLVLAAVVVALVVPRRRKRGGAADGAPEAAPETGEAPGAESAAETETDSIATTKESVP